MSLKWFLLLLVFLIVLVVLYFTGKKSVHQEIVIDASAEDVWTVLVNTDDYPSWNPVMQLLEGELTPNSGVKYRFTQDAENSSEISAIVQKVEPKSLLNQSGGIPFVLSFDHKYILEPVNDGTRIIIHEDYNGIGVNFWNPQSVETAYGVLINSLKERVEQLKN